MLLVAGLYEVPSGVNKPFGLRNGQLRDGDDVVVSLGGWYNCRGERLGWGSLSAEDFDRIRDELPTDEVFVVVDYASIFTVGNVFARELEVIYSLAETLDEPPRTFNLTRMHPLILSNLALWMVFPNGVSLNENILYSLDKATQNRLEVMRVKLHGVTSASYIFRMYFEEINIVDC